MLEKLMNKLECIEEEFTTTLQYDQTMQLQAGLSSWERGAIAYRIERKKLAAAARRVLEMYEDIVKIGTR
jgi:exonuclease VII small subunit